MAGSCFNCKHIAPVAGLYGNRIEVAGYRHGQLPSGTSRWCVRCADVEEPPADADELTDPDDLRKLREAILAQYAASGRFSPIELRTMQAIWLEDESLRSIAEREGVSPQAVRSRIEGKPVNGGHHGGIRNKAPEFADDWLWIKHARRRR